MSDIYPVKPEIATRSHVPSRAEYERLYRLSLDNPQWFWGEQAKTLSWFHPWQNVLRRRLRRGRLLLVLAAAG